VEILRDVGSPGDAFGGGANGLHRSEEGLKGDIDRLQSHEDLAGPTPELSVGRR